MRGDVFENIMQMVCDHRRNTDPGFFRLCAYINERAVLDCFGSRVTGNDFWVVHKTCSLKLRINLRCPQSRVERDFEWTCGRLGLSCGSRNGADKAFQPGDSAHQSHARTIRLELHQQFARLRQWTSLRLV